MSVWQNYSLSDFFFSDLAQTCLPYLNDEMSGIYNHQLSKQILTAVMDQWSWSCSWIMFNNLEYQIHLAQAHQ